MSAMADPGSIKQFSEGHRRIPGNGGRVGGRLASTPILLLHHVSAKSGIERVPPVAYHPHGDSAFLIVASNEGSPAYPNWYYSLNANPTIEIEIGAERGGRKLCGLIVFEEGPNTVRALAGSCNG